MALFGLFKSGGTSMERRVDFSPHCREFSCDSWDVDALGNWMKSAFKCPQLSSNLMGTQWGPSAVRLR